MECNFKEIADSGFHGIRTRAPQILVRPLATSGFLAQLVIIPNQYLGGLGSNPVEPEIFRLLFFARVHCVSVDQLVSEWIGSVVDVYF